MSKASEYAFRVEMASREPDPFQVAPYNNGKVETVASVGKDGGLCLRGACLPPEDVARFTVWLIETFGVDRKKSKR